MSLFVMALGIVFSAITNDIAPLVVGIVVAFAMLWLEVKYLHRHIHQAIDESKKDEETESYGNPNENSRNL